MIPLWRIRNEKNSKFFWRKGNSNSLCTSWEAQWTVILLPREKNFRFLDVCLRRRACIRAINLDSNGFTQIIIGSNIGDRLLFFLSILPLGSEHKNWGENIFEEYHKFPFHRGEGDWDPEEWDQYLVRCFFKPRSSVSNGFYRKRFGTLNIPEYFLKAGDYLQWGESRENSIFKINIRLISHFAILTVRRNHQTKD